MNPASKSQVTVSLLAIALICSLLLIGVAWAQIIVVPPPTLNPLNQTWVPEPPQIYLYVKNKSAAIALGKAFFWDMQAGSDGIVACATCHYGPGMVDKRLKNTLNPGTNGGDTIFGNNTLDVFLQLPGPVPGFPQFRPNYTLDPVNDFPLHRRQGVGHVQSDPIIQDTNDVVGSQGVRLSNFVGVGAFPDPSVDSTLVSSHDPIFRDPVYGNLRQVTGRNTPSVINAVFNFSNFWDGRASFVFNGENPYGAKDETAGVWFDDPSQPLQLVKRPVVIEYASLASQATGPPLDTTEMSGRGRTFPMLGRKLLGLTPLGKQLVSHDDSVLGGFAKSAIIPGARGLHMSYGELIRMAFENHLWNSQKLTPDGFTQMEANFSLFWGLAIQLYEATLISDDSPFDRWLAGVDNALTERQKLGFSLFSGVANCTACHLGIEFTDHSAASIAFQNNTINTVIEQMFTADGMQKIYDAGFNNTSIRPTVEDLGKGGTSPFTNRLTGQPFPLSLSRLAVLQRQSLLPFETPILSLSIPTNMPITADGAFKVPGLRNVELTGPYFHNGTDMTLDQVLNFYSRGGNFPGFNLHDLDPIIGAGLTLISNKQDLHVAIIDFLTSLTDPRVRNQAAPFDHPELFVPEGDPEVLTRIPATDLNGVPVAANISDFNNDSQTDILWHNIATGTVAVWLMNGTDWDSTVSVGTISDTNWKIVAADDFDGDHQTDILWRNGLTGENAVWLMTGTIFSSSVFLPSVPDTNWKIVETGDFNADTQADILWRHGVTGENVVWLMNGTTFTSSVSLPGVADQTWEIAEAGDFNRDGNTDILWRNNSNGSNVVWLMNQTAFSNSAFIPAVADTSWGITGVGDLNGDGRMDILWRNALTGDIVVWLMDGLLFSSAVSLPGVSDVNWQIVGP